MPTCEYCGKQLEKKNRRFCNNTCSAKWKSEAGVYAKTFITKTEDRTCELCGKHFTQDVLYYRKSNKRITKKDTRFCSASCRNTRIHSEDTKLRIKNGLANYDKERIIKNKRAKSVTQKCEKCGKEFNNIGYRKSKYCSPECRGRNVNKLKDEQGTYKILLCEMCGKEFKYYGNYANIKMCSKDCRNAYFSRLGKKRLDSDKENMQKWIESGNSNSRFGRQGVTEKGHSYKSSREKEVFEWLENQGFNFIVEKQLPDSSKYCDIYIVNDKYKKGYYIELDGLRREEKGSRFSWNGKLKHYEKLVKEQRIDGFKVLYYDNYKDDLLGLFLAK